MGGLGGICLRTDYPEVFREVDGVLPFSLGNSKNNWFLNFFEPLETSYTCMGGDGSDTMKSSHVPKLQKRLLKREVSKGKNLKNPLKYKYGWKA